MPRLGTAASVLAATLVMGCATSSGARDAAATTGAALETDAMEAVPGAWLARAAESRDSQSAAENEARLKVAIALQGSLSGEVATSMLESVSEAGLGKSDFTRVTVKVTADIGDVAPYIEVRAAAPIDGRFRAIAVVREGPLAQRLREDHAAHAARAMVAFRQTAEERTLVGQSRSWCAALADFRQERWRRVGIHRLTGIAIPSDDLERASLAARIAVNRLRAQRPVELRFKDSDGLARDVAGRMGLALEATGFIVRLATPGRKRTASGMEVTISRSASCTSPAPGVHDCRVGVVVTARSSEDQAALLTVQGERAAARDMSSAGPAGAQALAASQIEPQSTARIAVAALSTAIHGSCQP